MVALEAFHHCYSNTIVLQPFIALKCLVII